MQSVQCPRFSKLLSINISFIFSGSRLIVSNTSVALAFVIVGLETKYAAAHRNARGSACWSVFAVGNVFAVKSVLGDLRGARTGTLKVNGGIR